MECPQCKSDYVQKLSIIYESGTQQIHTTSNTVGGAAGYAGGFGGGAGTATTHTTGQSQSLLAQKAAPPKKKSYGASALVFFMGLVFLCMAMGGSNNSFLIFLASIFLAGFLVYKTYRYNQNEYPPKYQNWLKLWHCHRCGTIYAL